MRKKELPIGNPRKKTSWDFFHFIESVSKGKTIQRGTSLQA
jgi:hypothetical protein